MLSVAATAAASAAPAADNETAWSVSGSVGAVSHYVARGLSQSWGRPALQADVEVEHDSGFYAGLFGSSVSRRLFPGAQLETTLWLGYEREWGNNAHGAVDLLYVAYPGADASKGRCDRAPCASQSPGTAQVRLVGTWDWFTLRHGVALTDYYGASRATGYAGSTRGTTYTELEAEPELPWGAGWRLLAHLGATRFAARYRAAPGAASNPSYQDVRLGVSKSFTDPGGNWKLSLAWTRASNRAFYDHTASAVDSRTIALGRPRVVFGLAREFE